MERYYILILTNPEVTVESEKLYSLQILENEERALLEVKSKLSYEATKNHITFIKGSELLINIQVKIM